MMSISVIMPVYKAKQFVRDAVVSAAALPEVSEIILVEDGSNDGTYEKCLEIATNEPKVKLYQHPNQLNLGAGASRNLGVMRASRDFIAFLDADDRYRVGRFKSDMVMFGNDKELDGAYGAIQAEFTSESARRQFSTARMKPLTTISAPVEPEHLIYVLLGVSNLARGHISLDALTVRRRVFETVGYFSPALKLGQDTEWIIRLALKCRLKAGSITTPVATRGVHDNNRSTNVKKANKNRYLLWSEVLDWSVSNGAPLDVIELVRNRQLSWKTYHDDFLNGLWFLITLRRQHPELLDSPTYLRRLAEGIFGHNILTSIVVRWLSRPIHGTGQ